MISNHVDKAATKAARKAKEIHAPSWVSIAGHVYLECGDDLRPLRWKLLRAQKFKCAICGEFLAEWDMDLDHIQGGSALARCECYNRRLADGSLHTNVQAVHGMFSTRPCHRLKHNREPKWKSPTS